jgi:multiple sugar transport system permease protein
MGGNETMYRWKKRGEALLFVLPVLIPLVVFWLYPILRSVWISFTNWDYMTPEYDFVGLKNYIDLVHTGGFFSALKNTLVFGLGTAFPVIAGGFLLAVLVRSLKTGSKFYQFILFSPWITPTVAISIVWTWIFEPDTGIANMVLQLFHLPGLQWLHSSETAMFSVILVTVWKTLGYAMIFYLIALGKVPEELYDAGKVDGASRLSLLKNITIPMVSPTTLFLAVLTTVNALQAYDQIQVLTQGGPSGSTRTLLYLYYQLGFEQFHMGQAAASGVLLVIIASALAGLQFMISKKSVHY